MNKDNNIKDNSRSIDIDNININNLRDFTERLNSKELCDIFLGVRNGKLTFYYKGYELLNLTFDNNSIRINLRPYFNDNESLNTMIDSIIENMPLKYGDSCKTLKERINDKDQEALKIKSKSNQYYINLEDFHNYSRKIAFEYLLSELKKVMEIRFPNNKERQIQNLYTTNYNFKTRKELFIVDMEFACPGSLTDELGKNFKGRYDMIALKLDEDEKYYPVFIELKSLKNSIKDNKKTDEKSSGINGHIEDMDIFLNFYNKKGELFELIKNNILDAIKIKNKLKLISFDESLINFEKTEFWLLFDMVDCVIETKEDVEKIQPIYNTMKDSKVPLMLYKGTNGILAGKLDGNSNC